MLRCRRVFAALHNFLSFALHTRHIFVAFFSIPGFGRQYNHGVGALVVQARLDLWFATSLGHIIFRVPRGRCFRSLDGSAGWV